MSTSPKMGLYTAAALAVGALVSLSLLVGVRPGTAGVLAGGNLIQNPGADAGTGAKGNDVAPIPGWTTTGSFSAVSYGTDWAGAPPAARPPDAGANFFAGGPGSATSTAGQTVDVSPSAATIDAGRASATLGGYLGGWADQSDSATVQASFQSAAGAQLGSVAIGPVTAADRSSKTTFLARSATARVPAGTRAIRVVITALRSSGQYNDGYADSISLALRDTGVATTSPLAKLKATAEYAAFLGLKDKGRSAAGLEVGADRLARLAAAFPHANNDVVIPGESELSRAVDIGDMYRLLALSDDPAAIRSNIYAGATFTYERILRNAILRSGGNLDPAAVLVLAMQATHGDYPLAVLTAHNLLKGVTVTGRDVIAQMAARTGEKQYPRELARLHGATDVVSKLQSLRANPAASKDKMGPWYHTFAVLTAGAMVNPYAALAVVQAEHGGKAATTLLRQWFGSSADGVFKGEGGFDPEKYRIDRTFALRATSKQLRALSR